jgi:predicted  nucleic acid-binding Zn-ribbon protein
MEHRCTSIEPHGGHNGNAFYMAGCTCGTTFKWNPSEAEAVNDLIAHAVQKARESDDELLATVGRALRTVDL